MDQFRGTTIVSVRRNGIVAIAGDGQVSMGNTVMKGNARKIRTLASGRVIAGFAGGTADAFTLFELFESKLEQYGKLTRARLNWQRTGEPTDAFGVSRHCFVLQTKNALSSSPGTATLLNPKMT